MPFTLFKHINFRGSLSTLNLVRGLSQTYDIRNATGGTATNFTLPTAVDGFSVDNSTGILTVDLPHIYTAIDDIEVSASIGTINIPLSFKNWFPNNAPTDLLWFYSVSRSHDGSAQALWRGDYYYPGAVGGNLNTLRTITARSGQDGLLDWEALRDEVIGYNDSGVLRIEELINQVGDGDLVASGANEGLAMAIVDGSVVGMTQRGNNLFMRGKWSTSEFDANWTRREDNNSLFLQTSADFGNYYGLTTVQEKYDASISRKFRFGDDNGIPAIRNLPGNVGMGIGYKLALIVDPGDVIISQLTFEDPTLVIGDRYVVDGAYNKRIRVLNVESEDESESASDTDPDLQGGFGGRLEIADYFWNEAALWDVNNMDEAALEDWLRTKSQLASNYIALYYNTNRTYNFSS